MKKITYFIIAFILTIFLYGCVGYKPIFGSSNLQFKISEHSIKGNKLLGNKIFSKLNNLSKSNDNQNARSITLFINVLEDKIATAKNSSGKILEYKVTLNTEIKVKDFLTNDRILNKTFVSSITYKVQNQYSDTVNLENRSIQNLLDKTYQDLLIQLSKNILPK